MTGPGPGALSMFGDTYEPADPPATDRCPACHSPSTNGRTCQRCRAAGIEAPRLDLAPIGPVPTVRVVDVVDRLAEAREQIAALRGGLNACNACDAAPADPTDPAGYCPECGPGAYCDEPAPLAPDALAYWPQPYPA